MEIPVTTDEELNVLDSQLRRLKIEYEIFFSNPNKRPPSDIEWKVLSLLRKFSDGGGRMNFSQRYRYNEMAQRYAIYSDLWRKKSRIREEGYRRPQDALLSVQSTTPSSPPRKKLGRTFQATSTPSPHSFRKRLRRSASSISARTSNTPSNSPTATSNSKPKRKPKPVPRQSSTDNRSENTCVVICANCEEPETFFLHFSDKRAVNIRACDVISTPSLNRGGSPATA